MLQARLSNFTAILTILLVVVAGPASAKAPAGPTGVASGVTYERVGTFDVKKLNAVLNDELEAFLAGGTMSFAEFKGRFPAPKHAVTLYRVTYRTVVPEQNNRPVEAQGLVAIPEDGAKSHPLVSYQHGTVFDVREVPSQPDNSYETKLMLAAFAAQGYVVIGADYIGLAGSSMPNSYMVRDSSDQAALDMFYAARAVLDALGQKTSHVVLAGWSQGGWATMGFLRRLESLDMPLTAAFTASAPVDTNAAFRRPLVNPSPNDAIWMPACISNLIWAKEVYHGIPGLAAAAIRPEYLAMTKKFYDKQVDWQEYVKVVPQRSQDMMRPEFLATAASGRGALWDLLDAQQVYRWKVKTPLRVYHGDADEVVPPSIATLAESFPRMLGSRAVEARSAGPKADHRGTYVQAVIDAKPWIDGLVR